jgi:dTDP-4-dehydrorhamnose reductase
VQVYGQTKHDGEGQVLDRHDNAVVVRTSWLCAPQSANFVTVVAGRLRDGHRIDVVDDQFGCLTHADDLAHGLVNLARHDHRDAVLTGVVHLCNPGRWSRYQLAVAIAMELGIDPANVRPVTTSELDPPRPAQRPACVELTSTRPIDPLPPGSDALGRLLAGQLG